MFNLFKKQETALKPVEEEPKPTGEYYLECRASPSSYAIFIMRKTGLRHDIIIKQKTVFSDREREIVMADFKLNKNKYIREYDQSQLKNIRIPL